jgi:hypothetical protein
MHKARRGREGLQSRQEKEKIVGSVGGNATEECEDTDTHVQVLC